MNTYYSHSQSPCFWEAVPARKLVELMGPKKANLAKGDTLWVP